MKLKHLKVHNFRNLSQVQYQPGKRLNLVVGDNAQGKTSLLEAIYVLSTTGSFRTSRDNHLVSYDASAYSIKGLFESEDRNVTTAISYHQARGKMFEINGSKATSNHADRLRVVLFTPDDLYLIKGGPGKRRSFMDFALKQISPRYAHQLDNYGKIIKKRNLFLKKDQANGKAFIAANEVFMETAAHIILARINFVNLLEQTLVPIFNSINLDDGEVKMRYALSFGIDSDKINAEILKEHLEEQIQACAEDERRRRTSLVGPHLDDLNVYQDGKLARLFSSQGQQRNIVVAIKLAELEVQNKIRGMHPVFLLDEVLAELDHHKKEYLLAHLSKADYQTFLTSVDSRAGANVEATLTFVKNGNLVGKE